MQDEFVLVVRATKKLRDRVGPVTLRSGQRSTIRLGDWYATAWFWKPQLALLVSEATLFPVLKPLAPAARLLGRFLDHLQKALVAHNVPDAFIVEALAQMGDGRPAPTANRSVLETMNEFTAMAERARSNSVGFDPADLPALAGWLARTPRSPLYKRHTSPDRELLALVQQTHHQP
jgi:hypothetical protein